MAGIGFFGEGALCVFATVVGDGAGAGVGSGAGGITTGGGFAASGVGGGGGFAFAAFIPVTQKKRTTIPSAERSAITQPRAVRYIGRASKQPSCLTSSTLRAP